MSNEKNYTGLIPEHVEGKMITAESSADFDSIDQAVSAFSVGSEKLLDVNQWHEIAGKAFGTFKLTDSVGENVQGPAKEGFFFKIDITGPGPTAGKGFDWVEVEAIRSFRQSDIESLAMRVRPCKDPSEASSSTAHFYDDSSTSTFTITRENKTVTAAVYDRNTKPNKEADGVADKIRNTITGILGILGLSKTEWKALTDGLINESAPGQ